MAISKKLKAVVPADSELADDELNAEIAEDLAERQELDLAGRGSVGQRQRDHATASPELAGGDVDAAWDDAAGDGEELVGGDTPTPDQDRVDEIGQGAGLTYRDDEPLNYEKVLARDQHRWELNAASAIDPDADELAAEDDEEDDLDELGLLDGEAEALEVVDVDDLADDEDEAEEIEEADVDDLVELEDDDVIGPDDDEDEEEDDEEEEDDDEEDDDEGGDDDA